MDFRDRNRRGVKRLLAAFAFALQGVRDVVTHEKNMQLHLIIAAAVLALAGLLRLPLLHWVLLLLVIAGVFALEMMNTAVERVVDLCTEEFHPLAKRAKDIAAGAVFTYCLFAVVIGIILFLPPILRLLK